MCNAMVNVTCAPLQRYGKMFHGQTLKSATSDYDQRHVIAFRPISAAARSWSYDNGCCRTINTLSLDKISTSLSSLSLSSIYTVFPIIIVWTASMKTLTVIVMSRYCLLWVNKIGHCLPWGDVCHGLVVTGHVLSWHVRHV